MSRTETRENPSGRAASQPGENNPARTPREAMGGGLALGRYAVTDWGPAPGDLEAAMSESARHIREAKAKQAEALEHLAGLIEPPPMRTRIGPRFWRPSGPGGGPPGAANRAAHPGGQRPGARTAWPTVGMLPLPIPRKAQNERAALLSRISWVKAAGGGLGGTPLSVWHTPPWVRSHAASTSHVHVRAHFCSSSNGIIAV